MGFAALCLVTLVPLLIVVAAASPLPLQRRGFGAWVVDGMGLPAHSAVPVMRLFATRRALATTTSAFSLAALAVFGLTFVSAVQFGYERIWQLGSGPWHHTWRRVTWLAVLTGYLLAEVESGALLDHGVAEAAVRIILAVVFGLLFFWWGPYFLLGGRVSWRALLPGAVLTVVGLAGLRGFSSLVFAPLVVSNAISYGSVGTVLVVESWLIGVGFVIYGGALAGRHIHEHFERAREAEGS
jgi:membrane protein